MWNIIPFDTLDINFFAQHSRQLRREYSWMYRSWDTSAPAISVYYLNITGVACGALGLESSVIAVTRSPCGGVSTRRNSVVTVSGAQ